jgi:hypothetical protein
LLVGIEVATRIKIFFAAPTVYHKYNCRHYDYFAAIFFVSVIEDSPEKSFILPIIKHHTIITTITINPTTQQLAGIHKAKTKPTTPTINRAGHWDIHLFVFVDDIVALLMIALTRHYIWCSWVLVQLCKEWCHSR